MISTLYLNAANEPFRLHYQDVLDRFVSNIYRFIKSSGLDSMTGKFKINGTEYRIVYSPAWKSLNLYIWFDKDIQIDLNYGAITFCLYIVSNEKRPKFLIKDGVVYNKRKMLHKFVKDINTLMKQSDDYKS